MKIEKMEGSFVVKTNFGRIIEAFDTRQEAEAFMERKIKEDRVADLDRFRWWECAAD